MEKCHVDDDPFTFFLGDEEKVDTEDAGATSSSQVESPSGASSVAGEEEGGVVTVDPYGVAEWVGDTEEVDLAVSALSMMPSLTVSASASIVYDGDTEEELVSATLPVGGIFQHAVYKTVHRRHELLVESLACCRKLSDKFVRIDSWPVACWHRCKKCFPIAAP